MLISSITKLLIWEANNHIHFLRGDFRYLQLPTFSAHSMFQGHYLYWIPPINHIHVHTYKFRASAGSYYQEFCTVTIYWMYSDQISPGTITFLPSHNVEWIVILPVMTIFPMIPTDLHPLVHVSPMSMIVAVAIDSSLTPSPPPPQHSPRLGHL